MIFRRSSEQPFADRRQAGRELGDAVVRAGIGPDPMVLALPRGGVPVGYEVSKALGAPLYAFVVRKLGAPGNPELAIGAIAADGTTVIDGELVRELGVDETYLEAEVSRQRAEVERRLQAYGGELLAPDVKGRTVVLVDDGVATGATTRAALMALRSHEPRELVLAVPVGTPEVIADLEQLADQVLVLKTPVMLFGVGSWYVDFSQTPDAQVIRLIESANRG